MDEVKRANRRHGPDTMVKAINILAGATWFLVLIVFIMVTFAKPRMETFFDREYSISLSGRWDQTVLSYAFFLLMVLVFICFIGIMINMSRHRRKTDRYNRSLIWFGVISLLGMFYYLIYI
jgi:hypothetical protein